MKVVHLIIPGEPAPKGSRVAGVRKNGTVFTRPANAREKDYQNSVAAVVSGMDQLEPPYEVEIRFRFLSPQKPKYKYPSRNDVDKLARCLLDGLVAGGLLVDDRHITRLVAQKEYGTEGAVVLVRSLQG